jgi:hypothetical protein
MLVCAKFLGDFKGTLALYAQFNPVNYIKARALREGQGGAKPAPLIAR